MSTHRLYNFPPMFTLQVNAQTRRKQQEVWSEIIVGYCEAHKQPMLDVAKCPLFRNENIHRALNSEDAGAILDYLVESNRAEWDNADTKQRCRVFYRSLAECADLLYKKISVTGRIGDVFTMKEIRAELPPAFSAALDDYAIGKVLALMEEDGRARTFERGGRIGATFFAAAAAE